MQIKMLGVHNLESENTRLCSLLIDGVLAIDAGSLTCGLSLADQQKLKAVLISHEHYDHIRDIPALAINYQEHDKTIDVYSIQNVYEALANHLLNDVIYPNFMKRPQEKPAVRFQTLEPGTEISIAGYEVLPLKVTHAIETVGYRITSADSKTLFYTSDTGPGLTECWKRVSPNLLVIETTVPNEFEEFALRTGHLTPKLLQKELEEFRKLKNYVPETVTVHLSPIHENKLKAEIAAVARNLNAKILPGFEGMQLEI
jgi:cAMP phosphodiesterase